MSSAAAQKWRSQASLSSPQPVTRPSWATANGTALGVYVMRLQHAQHQLDEPLSSCAIETSQLCAIDDRQAYRTLLHTAMVVERAPWTNRPADENNAKMHAKWIDETVNAMRASAVEDVLTKKAFSPNGVYNSLVAELKSSKWRLLHERAGSAILEHLMRNTTILTLLSNNNYLQLTGPPLFLYENMPTLLPKRKAQDEAAATALTTKPTAAAAIKRAVIFYARPALVRRNGEHKVAFGFRRYHLLQDANLTADRLAVAIASGTTEGIDSKTAKDYGWRWAAAKPLLEQLLQRHRQTTYVRALRRHCPSPLDAGREVATLDLSQFSAHEQVASFINSALLRVVPLELLGSRHNRRAVFRLIERFVRMRRFETVLISELTRGFRPSECAWLWNKRKGNAEGPMEHKPPSFHHAAQHAASMLLRWIVEHMVIPLIQSHFYVTETTPYRHRVFYFRHDVWRRITAAAQVASASFKPLARNEALTVFRARSIGFSHVRWLPKEAGLRPIVNLNREQRHAEVLGPAPSTSGSTSWTKRFNHGEQRLQAINKKLSVVFNALKFEKDNLPQLLGASAFGLNDVYLRFKKLKQFMVSRQLVGAKPLYFAVIDVKGAFDSIKQEKLIHIMRSIIRRGVYCVQKYATLQRASGRLRRTFSQVASAETPQAFTDLAALLARTLRNTVIVDRVFFSQAEGTHLMSLLEEHIRFHIVKIGSHLYRQRDGIPQGSVLSTILCSFFYGDLERRHLQDFMHRPDELLVRFVDDYLYITPDQHRAEGLVSRLIDGFPEYGLTINPNKTVVNFDVTLRGIKLRRPSCPPGWFPWCGMLVNEQLSVQADYSRWIGIELSDTLSVTMDHPGTALKLRLRTQLKPKTHAVYIDTSLIDRPIVLLNIYRNFLLCAIKMCSYLKALAPAGFQPHREFLQDLVEDCVSYAHGLLKSRVYTAAARKGGCQCNVEASAITWLGFHAFSTALGTYGQQHSTPLIPSLDARVAELGSSMSEVGLRQLVEAAEQSQCVLAMMAL